MPSRTLIATPAALLAAVLPLPAAAHAAAPAPYVGGQVIVKYRGKPAQLVPVRRGEGVRDAVARLRARRDVAYAVPDYVGHISGYIPDDPGLGGQPGDWQKLQWNFTGPAGINAPDAWLNLIATKRYGGRGVTVAVIDTGVAYENRGRFRRSPDFKASQFTRGYDFVGKDPHPDDQHGHGTFVAGIIGERVNNGEALTGLAYGAKIMPVRVLDSDGLGDADVIARGIRWAVGHGADVINLSLEFDSNMRAGQLPTVISALRYAARRGVVVVGASGNEAEDKVSYPARSSAVISVGATTEHVCLAEYSNTGFGLDIVAPGGGQDAAIPGEPRCKPTDNSTRNIFSFTLTRRPRTFGYPTFFVGTSMSAPHVAAAAALVIASGVLGPHPTPLEVKRRLQGTAHDLGQPGYDLKYGHGLLDAAAATRPGPPQRAPLPPLPAR
jgi:serine protease